MRELRGRGMDTKTYKLLRDTEMDQLNRPRTRGLEASEAEEDVKAVKAALKEPQRFIKRAHQKLKHDYGRDEDLDEEERIFYEQPAYEDEESEVKPGTKRKRGGGRRGNFRRRIVRSLGDGGGEDEVRRPMSARLAAILKEELTPRIVPYNRSSIELNQIWHTLGDIVSIHKDSVKYFAQILGFHTDQFCERYASIRWLIPKWKLDDTNSPPLSAECFESAVPHDEPVSLNGFKFELRPSSHYFEPEHPQTVTRDNYYLYNSEKCYFDSSSPTLTSADKRY